MKEPLGALFEEKALEREAAPMTMSASDEIGKRNDYSASDEIGKELPADYHFLIN